MIPNKRIFTIVAILTVASQTAYGMKEQPETPDTPNRARSYSSPGTPNRWVIQPSSPTTPDPHNICKRIVIRDGQFFFADDLTPSPNRSIEAADTTPIKRRPRSLSFSSPSPKKDFQKDNTEDYCREIDPGLIAGAQAATTLISMIKYLSIAEQKELLINIEPFAQKVERERARMIRSFRAQVLAHYPNVKKIYTQLKTDAQEIARKNPNTARENKRQFYQTIYQQTKTLISSSSDQQGS